VPAVSFARHCKLSVDVVNIIDQNHASAVLPTGKGPVVPVDEGAKLPSEPVWVLLRRAKCFPLPDRNTIPSSELCSEEPTSERKATTRLSCV
jgi:hypothetical protein